MVSASSYALYVYVETSSEHHGSFELHTKGLGSKLMKRMRINAQGLGKIGQGMKNNGEKDCSQP
jgi:hypothetical protein